MVYPATDEIYAAMKAHDLSCGIEARETSSILHIGLNTERTEFEALFISRNERNDVALRIYNLVKFPPEKLDDMIETVNGCNVKFRFLKFSVDIENHSVDAAYDFALTTDEIGECAYEILLRCAGIIDECHPILMKVLGGA